MQNATFSDLRPSPIAGSWYSSDPAELKADIQGYFKKAPSPAFGGEVVSLIVPHAGHVYSGLTAAHAFKALDGRHYDKVVLVAPSHHAYRSALLTTGHQAYWTPLGAIPVDHTSLESLELPIEPVRHDQEHSLEIELPFLQTLLPQGFDLLPIVMLEQSEITAQSLGQALAQWANSLSGQKRVLLVASSDLSHFHSESQANLLDGQIINALKTMDPAELHRVARLGKGEACGLGPMAAILTASGLLGANHLTITDYRTSAAVNHDHRSVVGYVSAVITKPT
ncbi:MAG: AmmeMemoRadiSam system protein B [Chloroflexi bacterium]|nr:AmmeMemoRadiSam system protein B [Chloroflexota bacterium]